MGAVAAASGTVTEAVGTIATYFRNMSKIKNEPKRQDSDSDLPPYLEHSESLEVIESRNPVSRAADYSSHHLAHIAYQMASKSLAPSPELRKRKKSNSWSPVPKAITARRTFLREQAMHGRQEVHGRAHEAAYETGHFVEVMLDIGLKGRAWLWFSELNNADLIVAPVAFFYNIANGFHNAPSFLFNDETVRRRDNITGLGSGVKVAGKVR
jgi:sterol 3beta-glucosyltransferase